MFEQEEILWDHIQYLYAEIWGSYMWAIIIMCKAIHSELLQDCEHFIFKIIFSLCQQNCFHVHYGNRIQILSQTVEEFCYSEIMFSPYNPSHCVS